MTALRAYPNAFEPLLTPEENVEHLAAILRKDDAALREAEECTAGDVSAEHYSALRIAAAELSRTDPSDLLGSDVLTLLYRLGKDDATAIDAHLLKQARDYLEMRSVAWVAN